MLVELKKVDQLTQYPYLTSKILHPAVDYARQRKLISEQEHAVLSATVKAGVVKTGDLTGALPDMSDTQRTYQVRKLVEAKMLRPIAAKSRQYTIGFDNSYLLRGVIHALLQEGFVSASLKGAAP